MILSPYAASTGSAPLTPQLFGAKGDGTTDDTAAIQAAINAAQTTLQPLYIPGAVYKTTSTLNITAKCKIYGDGSKSSTIALSASLVTTYALTINLPDNASIIGMDLRDFGFTCDNGSAHGSGVKILTTNTNSAISQSTIKGINIFNCTVGWYIDAVLYMSTLEQLTTVGSATYGWQVVSTANQFIYNTIRNIECTNVASNAYAYNIVSSNCRFENLTADGCANFSGAYSSLDGFTIEGIFAATPSAASALVVTQFNSIKNISIQGVPNSKCTSAIDVQGTAFSVENVRIPDAGAGNQPNTILLLHAGNTGIIFDVQCDRAPVNLLEANTALSTLSGFIFIACTSITANWNLNYNAPIVWVPTFTVGNGWTTAPTLISAQYVQIGRQVTVSLYAQDGVCTDGAKIAALPFAANATFGGAAYGGCSDRSKNLHGSILPAAQVINNIPAFTLTGNFWQFTATYFV